MLGGQCCEDAATDTKIGLSHVRAFLGAFETESDAAKVVGSHGRFIVLREQRGSSEGEYVSIERVELGGIWVASNGLRVARKSF